MNQCKRKCREKKVWNLFVLIPYSAAIDGFILLIVVPLVVVLLAVILAVGNGCKSNNKWENKSEIFVEIVVRFCCFI